jgi:hypothetical protein
MQSVEDKVADDVPDEGDDGEEVFLQPDVEVL